MTDHSPAGDEVARETAWGLSPAMLDAPQLGPPRRVVLRPVPGLEALPPVGSPRAHPLSAGAGVSAPAEPRWATASATASVTAGDGRPARVAPPRSTAMSSPARRLRAQALEALLFVVLAGVGWVAWSVALWSTGRSPAKALMRMRCIDTRTGAAAGRATMARRAALTWGPGVLTLGLALLVGGAAAFGERREALWDKAARTIVIDDPDGRYAP
jgi:hypothetical protein